MVEEKFTKILEIVDTVKFIDEVNKQYCPEDTIVISLDGIQKRMVKMPNGLKEDFFKFLDDKKKEYLNILDGVYIPSIDGSLSELNLTENI